MIITTVAQSLSKTLTSRSFHKKKYLFIFASIGLASTDALLLAKHLLPNAITARFLYAF